jgi:hypothetical protein
MILAAFPSGFFILTGYCNRFSYFHIRIHFLPKAKVMLPMPIHQISWFHSLMDHIILHIPLLNILTLLDNNNNIPEREKGKRNAFLNNAKISCDRNKNKFEEIRKKKFGFDDTGKHDEYLQKYENDENMKNKNNAELLQYQQDKLKSQDNQIDDIIADVAKGKQMGKAIHGKLQDQNVLLEQIDENMDKLDSKMERTKKKFETYLKKSSNCCLITIMIIELAILIFFITRVIKKNK